MFTKRKIYSGVIGSVLLFCCTFIFAQTTDRRAIKSTPLIQQTKPQTDIQKAQTDQLMNSLPKDRQNTLKAVSTIIAKQLLENMQSDKSDRRKEDDARKFLAAGMEKTAIITNAENETALMQNTQSAVSYGLQANVYRLAAKVKTNTYVKNVLREEIAVLEDLIADWSDETVVQAVSYRSCIKLDDGSYEIDEKTKVMSKEQVEALIEEMENQLNTLADINANLMLELQDAQNKQSQMMQMMSNIMKSMNDTAKAIIKNLK